MLYRAYGFYAVSKSDGPWIGLFRVKDNHWLWSDGSKRTGDFWTKGQPDNAGKNEHCTQIWEHTGEWNDASCNTALPYICQIELDGGYENRDDDNDRRGDANYNPTIGGGKLRKRKRARVAENL